MLGHELLVADGQGFTRLTESIVVVGVLAVIVVLMEIGQRRVNIAVLEIGLTEAIARFVLDLLVGTWMA